MWSPVSITLKNIMTHSDTTFRFVSGRVVMIKGVNKYDDKPKSNGSGKSAIIEAVSIAISGDHIRKVPQSVMIKDGEDSAMVQMVMVNSVSGSELVIKRELFSSKRKPSSLKILVDGVPVDFVKIADGNEYILKLIGVSKEDLFNYFIISKKKYVSFYYSSDGDKRALISRFSKSDRVSKVYDVIKSDESDALDKVAYIDSDIQSMTGKISAYEEMLESELSSPKLAMESIMSNIDSKLGVIDKIKGDILSASESLSNAKELLSLANKKVDGRISDLNSFKPVDYTSEKKVIKDRILSEEGKIAPHNSSKADINEIISAIDIDIRNIKSKITKYEVMAANLITCPSCSHQFAVSSDMSKASIESTILVLNADLDKANNNKKECLDLIASIDKDISTINSSIEKMQADLKNFNKLESEQDDQLHRLKALIRQAENEVSTASATVGTYESRINSANENIESYSKMVSDLMEELEQLKSNKNNNSDMLNRIEQAKLDLDALNAKKVELLDEVSSISKWSEVFKRFIIKLSNMAIKSIESITNDVLAKMGVNLSIEVDGYKVNQSGTISDIIDTKVLRYGLIEGSIFRFSEGEQAMINISTIIAMQQLINMGSPTGGLDMLFIDEITESMDSSVISVVAQALDRIGRTMVVITHVSDEETMIPNEVIVTKTSEGSTCQTK